MFRVLAFRQREQRWPFVMFLSDEGPTLETLHFTICIGSTPFFYISICICRDNEAHCVYFTFGSENYGVFSLCMIKKPIRSSHVQLGNISW